MGVSGEKATSTLTSPSSSGRLENRAVPHCLNAEISVMQKPSVWVEVKFLNFFVALQFSFSGTETDECKIIELEIK